MPLEVKFDPSIYIDIVQDFISKNPWGIMGEILNESCESRAEVVQRWGLIGQEIAGHIDIFAIPMTSNGPLNERTNGLRDPLLDITMEVG